MNRLSDPKTSTTTVLPAADLLHEYFSVHAKLIRSRLLPVHQAVLGAHLFCSDKSTYSHEYSRRTLVRRSQAKAAHYYLPVLSGNHSIINRYERELNTMGVLKVGHNDRSTNTYLIDWNALELLPEMKRKCSCGKVVKAKRRDAKHCSESCKQKAKRARRDTDKYPQVTRISGEGDTDKWRSTVETKVSTSKSYVLSENSTNNQGLRPDCPSPSMSSTTTKNKPVPLAETWIAEEDLLEFAKLNAELCTGLSLASVAELIEMDLAAGEEGPLGYIHSTDQLRVALTTGYRGWFHCSYPALGRNVLPALETAAGRVGGLANLYRAIMGWLVEKYLTTKGPMGNPLQDAARMTVAKLDDIVLAWPAMQQERQRQEREVTEEIGLEIELVHLVAELGDSGQSQADWYLAGDRALGTSRHPVPYPTRLAALRDTCRHLHGLIERRELVAA
jgi:hypothetical protein